MPIAFDDSELEILMRLSTPIDWRLRGEFLEEVARELARFPEQRGDGTTHRVGREIQRRYVSPLPATAGTFHSKYR